MEYSQDGRGYGNGGKGGKGRGKGKGIGKGGQYQGGGCSGDGASPAGGGPPSGGYGGQSYYGHSGGYQQQNYQQSYQNQGKGGYRGGYQGKNYQENYQQQHSFPSGGFDEQGEEGFDDDEQLDEIFAVMDAMGITDMGGEGGEDDDGVPSDIYDELTQLKSLDNNYDVTLMAPSSPKMNVSAAEFTPGCSFVPASQPRKMAPAPAAAPPPPATPASQASTPAASPAPPPAAAAPLALPVKDGVDPVAIRLLINQAAYKLKVENGGTLDLSFKARKDVLFPQLEAAVTAAYPQAENGFKPYLRMDLRNFIAETLRPWEKDQEWFVPPATSE